MSAQVTTGEQTIDTIVLVRANNKINIVDGGDADRLKSLRSSLNSAIDGASGGSRDDITLNHQLFSYWIFDAANVEGAEYSKPCVSIQEAKAEMKRFVIDMFQLYRDLSANKNKTIYQTILWEVLSEFYSDYD